jgi:hypothetical protein
MENNLGEQFEKTIESLSKAISFIIRNVNNKEETINALNKINPPIESLRKIYKAALENEDYETCDAIKAFFERFYPDQKL